MPKFKSKQPASFFLLGIRTPPTGETWPIGYFALSSQISTLFSWDKRCKRWREASISPNPFQHLMQNAPEILFHKHTQSRGAKFLPLCLSSVYTFVVIKSDSVSDYITYKAMLKRPKTVEITLQRSILQRSVPWLRIMRICSQQNNICSLKSLTPNQILQKKTHSSDPLTLTCLSKLRNRNYFYFISSHSP